MLSLGLRRVVTSEFRGEPLSGPLVLTRRRNRERLVGYGGTRGSLSTHSFVFIFFIVFLWVSWAQAGLEFNIDL